MKERLYKKAVKFANFSFIGTTTFAMQLFFTLMFTELFSITYYFSHAIALVIAWTANFFFNRKITFAVKDKVSKRLRRFAALAVTNSAINWFFVLLFVEKLSVHYFIAIILVTLVLSVFMFTTEELWVFRKSRACKVRQE